MNYSECMIELIKTCPLKEYPDNKINWSLAEINRDYILSCWDSELLTMANIALFETELNTDYMLIVGSRYGTMNVLDNTRLVQVRSYYLWTGLMFGPSTQKKRQFSFEISAVANKKGISFQNSIDKRTHRGETGIIFSKLSQVLNSFYSRPEIEKLESES